MISTRRKWAGRATALTALTATTTMAFSGLAFADIIQNDIDSAGDTTITAGGSTKIGYDIKVEGKGLDGAGGCNASDGTPAKVVLSVPDGVTATGLTDKTLTFTSCESYQYVTFSAAAAGDYPITVDKVVDDGTGTYTTTPANFTLKVSAATPTNTAPVVSVTGVADGATYEKSSVPQPGCSVVDAEDTNESATAVIAGGAAYNDLGSRTATCSYTDGGGITRSASATYTVVRDKDTTAPVITKTVTGGTEGLNGWYTGGNVSLDWTVTEGESPETLVLTGCDDVIVSADQAATEYSCSATSEGGTAAKQTVSIKRDGTAPVVTNTATASGTQGLNGWYTSDVEVTFKATDNLSGFAGDLANPHTFTKTTSGDGSSVTVGSGTVSDVAGNTSNAVTSSPFKIDSQAPNAPTASLSPAPNGAGWNNSNVVVDFEANGDNGPSGVDTCTADKTVSTEGANQTVSGTCTDAAGNVSAAKTVTVNLDNTKPVITQTATVSGTEGLNGWYTSNVTVEFRATDNLSGFAGALTNPHTFTKTISVEGPAVTVSSGTVNDVAGNTSNSLTSSAFAIDKAVPTNVAFVDGPAAGSSPYFGSVPAAPTCTADDATSGIKDCVVTGHSTAVGTHTMTATATDNAGHTTTAQRTYTVQAWTTKGFYSPVDMGNVFNTVKGGSTVPLKFELFAGTTELTSTSSIASFTTKRISCTTGTSEDAIEELATTGGTSLRYDTTGGQFIQNWKTPTGAGTCYSATMTALDGSSITALFKIK